ncbi:carboxymethylenebutenolidase [Daldinia caldariorum]|uniref:carboxymethylenebutenolidase n=1 Tax=Daldinia caldariorum TaxID=326644 RepID=UPI002008D2C9|nr:carboxymethylenebutenolidase [Daldinia caldariorum]KAI1463744.1 carboxymethylenebutenolidase [Daldinia caldariorum]
MTLKANTIADTKSSSVEQSPNLTIQPPLSRRGHGPGLLLLLDAELDLRKHERTLDPPPLHKWAEEGFAVAQLRITKSDAISIRDGIRSALSALLELPSCDQAKKIGVIAYIPLLESLVLETIEAQEELCAVICYGMLGTDVSSNLPLLAHVPGLPAGAQEDRSNEKRYYYENAKSFFPIPAHRNYHTTSASVAHTRSLAFMKPLVGGPYFDIEKVWEEHTYWEFQARSVEETMATMVEEPYVNHVPTLTGGTGRQALTEFYRENFIFSNPPDTQLELVSRTVGIDRVVDEFVFKATHDRVINWLVPGVPATGRFISIPFTSVVNIRGDRLYHEHISWDQATLLRQLGLLPEYLPFPYPIASEPGAPKTNLEYRLPVAGIESAHKLADQSAADSNKMLHYKYRNSSAGL